MTACIDLIRFVDGELDPERAAAFRDHLAGCPACRAALVPAMQLSTRIGALTPAPETVRRAAALSSKPVALPVRGTASRDREAPLPNRTGCAGLVVWTVSTVLPATAITLLRMWPWVHRTRCRSQDSTA